MRGSAVPHRSPGTYSLRGRSPDEEVTRDVVLGRLANEAPPELLLCVADATNLRVSLRLLLELKRVGRPMILVLNMIDIARRRGIEIDLDRLSAELGVPVVTSTAGAPRRHRRSAAPPKRDGGRQPCVDRGEPWQPPSTGDLRAAQREADRIIAARGEHAGKPDTVTARIDAVLCIRSRARCPAGFLFVMFQAVFAWAKPLMDLDLGRLRRARRGRP